MSAAPRPLDIQNLPTPKEERWKYTNLPKAMPSGLRLVTDTTEKVIHIPRGQICEQVEDIVWAGQDGQHLQPRLKITLEDNAELTVIERHDGQGAYWKNMTSEIEIGANAKLTHIRIQDDAPEAVHTNMVSLTLEKDARYNGVALNIGAKMSRHEIHSRLLGTGIECALSGANLLRAEQHADTTILMEHEAPHCTSHQNYRHVVDDRANSVFQGKVHVHQIAQKTDGYQKSDTILLSEFAQMNTKPELEIYADDVKCSHGTTTGQLDANALFYLRARGIPEAEARALLVQSFVGEALSTVTDEAMLDELNARIVQWLSQTS